MSYEIQLGNTTREIPIPMTASSDHVSPATGLTMTVTIRKPGGSFAAPAGVVSEIANGWYKIAPNATDANTLGPLLIHATAPGADPMPMLIQVVAYNPDDAVRMGLTALPNANAAAANGLPTVGTGAGQLSVSGGGVPLRADEPVRVGLVPGSGQVADGAPTASGFITNIGNTEPDHWINYNLEFINGACAPQQRQIASYNGATKAITLVRPFSRAPANGDAFNLISAPDVGAVTGMARVLGLSGDLMVEDDVVMDSNGSGFRISWNYYIYDTEVNRAAHVYQSPNATRTGLRFKYAASRHILSGVVADFTMSRVL